VATTLLLADDSLTIQRVIELTFADEEVFVVTVSDGHAAMTLIDAQPPDIVLADIGMPGKTGYEVAAHVKHSPRTAHIPVLLLTGAFEPVDQRKAQESGCDGVMTKPFEPHVVIGRVRELLERSRRGGAAAPATRAATSAARAPHEPSNDQPGPVAAHVDAAPANASSSEIGDFFDQLDAAFARLPGTRSAPETVESAVHSGEPPAAWLRPQAPAAVEGADNWDGIVPSTVGPGRPSSQQSAGTRVVYSLPANLSSETPVFLQPMESQELRESAVAAPARPSPAMPLPVPPLAVESSVPSPSVVLPAVVLPSVVPPAVVLPSPVHPAVASSPVPPTLMPSLPPPLPAFRDTVPATPPLADAFAALLDAEEPGAPPADLRAWAPPPPAPLVTDELIEQIVQRVLARLSDHAVLTTVADVVSSTAERLIREEIDRIKAAIK
jgi:CheY-like chemotaxis protein